MTCSHSNIEIDRAAKVYRCSACKEVVGHFMTVAERTERQTETEQYGRKLKGLVSIGNGLYVKTKRPYCRICGWRKGGVDSWDGTRCKCGISA